MSHKRDANSIAQVASNHFGPGLVDKESSAVEKFHQTASGADATFRKEN
jgi:hypothetical protein